MTKILLRGLLLCSFPLASLEAKAQTPHAHTPESTAVSCQVVDLGITPEVPTREDAFRAFPIKWGTSDNEDLIYNGPGIYVFRFAACISNAEFRSSRFNRNKAAVYSFWESLEEYMNRVYVRDCGIRFEIIKDDKLILSEGEHPLLTNSADRRAPHEKATEIINDLWGVDNYEVGILITPRPSGDPNDGIAAKSGVMRDNHKASARSVSDYKVITHEVGHLFGSIHTHEVNPKGSIFTEAGSGQSIMSYGSPTNFFSLPTVQTIRKSLKSLPYYTDENRSVRVTEGKQELASAPHIEKRIIEAPELLHNELSKEYKVTPNTRYQFYIPVKEKRAGDLYAAHSFDPTNGRQPAHNIQRCYGPSSHNLIMFHPRYQVKPSSTSSNSEPILAASDKYQQDGVYTYLLSAYQQGLHDAHTVKLRIVPGPKFAIKSVKGFEGWYNDGVPGRKFSLEWEPCVAVYGQDSRVRILLSDDFGETFKYVLADNVPNTGSFSGYIPYVSIGRSHILDVRDVRSGILKVEVIGEAAYALSHEEPYIKRGKQYIGTGGILIDKANTKAVRFDPMPDVYVEVQDEAQIPEAIELSASYGGRSQKVSHQDRIEGNVIYRTWTANLNGTVGVYSQLIKVHSRKNPIDYALRSKLRALQDRVADLYDNIGSVGYPYAQLPESKQLRAMYEKIFIGNDVSTQVTEEDYTALNRALEALSGIPAWKLVKPISGYSYKLASYSRAFGKDWYHYIKEENGEETFLRDQESKGSTWEAKEQDGVYKFTTANHTLSLNGISNFDGGIILQKGYTWGAFMVVGHNADGSYYYVRTNKETGELSKYPFGNLSVLDYFRSNADASSVTTDFVFKPIGKAYSVYLEQGSWSNAKAILRHKKQTVEVASKSLGNGRFEFEIPAAFFLGSVEFVNADSPTDKSPVAYLGGVSAVYSHSGKRIYETTLDASNYTTLYLDYPVSIPQGIKAYVATAKPKLGQTVTEYHLDLAILQGIIPAKTPVIIRGEGINAKKIRFEEADFVAPPENNSLMGSLEDVQIVEQKDDFLYFDLSAPTISSDKYSFSPVNKSKNLSKNSAYLRLYRYKSGEQAQRLVLAFDQFEGTPPPAPEMTRITLPSTPGGQLSLANGINAEAVAVGTEVAVVVSPNTGYELVSLKVNGVDITHEKKFTVRSGDNRLEVVWKNTTGLHEGTLTTLMLYPNPTRDFTNLRGGKLGAEYQLYTLSGVLVRQGIITDELQRLSLVDLPSGTYVLRVADTSLRVQRL